MYLQRAVMGKASLQSWDGRDWIGVIGDDRLSSQARRTGTAVTFDGVSRGL
jgi:hypothetical protein